MGRGWLRRRGRRALAATISVCAVAASAAGIYVSAGRSSGVGAEQAREVHFTFSGPRSVTFDWVGSGDTIRFGRTAHYSRTATAHAPCPEPFSSSGPFREATLTRLKAGKTYHYSIGGDRDRVFSTVPKARYRFDFEADIGDSESYRQVGPSQAQIARDRPAFVLAGGDLTYGNDDGQAAVDRHFQEVMVWSRRAAYMPVWGNHEWDDSSDDLRNYKGRFALPHAHASPGAPRAGCCGEDWSWFDAGPVRFISWPEPYSDESWSAWRTQAGRVMAAAEATKRIRFIVAFGHRPPYSTGFHRGDPDLAAILDGLGDRYHKFVLSLNGHSHDYERYQPIHHIVYVTSGGGGGPLEPPWHTRDPRTAFRAMHLQHLRIGVTPGRLRLEAVCGPETSDDDISCRPGAVIDSYTIRAPR